MSDKPTDVPEWTPTGLDVVEPSGGEKSSGWQPDDRPPAQYINWFWSEVSAWMTWLFNGVLQRSSLTNNAPVLSTSDRNGRHRHTIGPEGFLMGPAIQSQVEFYNVAVSAASSAEIEDRLFGTTDTNTSLATVLNSVYGENHRVLEMELKNAAVSQACRVHDLAGAEFEDLDNLCCVIEQRLFMSAVAENVDINWGLHEDPDLNTTAYNVGTTYAMVMLEKARSQTNWFTRATDGVAATDQDSGVPPVASTFQTLRIEYHGLNTPVGVAAGFAVARFFIDGTEVEEVADANVPSGSNKMGFSLRARAHTTGPVGDFHVCVGPLKIAYNQVLTGDIPA